MPAESDLPTHPFLKGSMKGGRGGGPWGVEVGVGSGSSSCVCFRECLESEGHGAPVVCQTQGRTLTLIPPHCCELEY